MRAPQRERLAGSFGWREPGHGGPAERLLRGLGADAAFVDDVLGDLEEESARRREAHGAFAARAWYVAEAVRAAPHLAWNAMRHGGWPAQLRVAAVIAGALAIPVAIATMVTLYHGTPVRLVVEQQHGAGENEIIINSRKPVRLLTHAFDRRGRALPADVVTYRQLSGDAVTLSSYGVLTCAHRADAEILATAGKKTATLRVHCRPVKSLSSYVWMRFVVGDSAEEVPLLAATPDGLEETALAGERWVADTTVARLSNLRLYPLAAGATVLVTRIGDSEVRTAVRVFEPVPTLDDLRDDQRYAIAPVTLGPGESVAWRLPAGRFHLQYARDEAARPMPALHVSGNLQCAPALGPDVLRTRCVARAAGALLHIRNPYSTLSAGGRVSIERVR